MVVCSMGARSALALAVLAASIGFSGPSLAQPVIAPPSGYGHYCSGTRGLGSPSSEFHWGTSSSTPCLPCAPNTFCTIRQAGLWNPNGINRVYAICADGARFWGAASGDSALTSVKAAAASHPRCSFNVSPKELRVFHHPYSALHDFLQGVEDCEVVGGVVQCWSNANVFTGDGVDLANNTTFTLAQLGIPGLGVPKSEVDHEAHFMDFTHPIRENHLGYDFRPTADVDGSTFETARVRAVAAGRVVFEGVRGAGDGCAGQVEVFIHHVVGSSLTTHYREEFWSYYAHMEAAVVVAGQDVVAFQDLGEIGFTGGACTGPDDHIHFGVTRIRNVTGALMEVPPVGFAGWNTTERRMIDPFGWNGPSYDPWAFFAPAGFGAASMNLWKEAYTPPDWPWH